MTQAQSCTTLVTYLYFGISHFQNTLLEHTGLVLSAQFTLDGRWLLTLTRDTLSLWDADSGRRIHGPDQQNSFIFSWMTEFSPDGTRLLVTLARSFVLWDTQTWRPVTEFLRSPGWTRAAQLSPDGKRLATFSGADSYVRLWNTATAELITEPIKVTKHLYGPPPARFSPDGKQLLIISGMHPPGWSALYFLDAESGQPIGEPLKYDSFVKSAEFSQDGTRIVTASYDKTARIWDSRSGQPLTDSFQHDQWLSWAQFSPEGKRILTVSTNTVCIWDLAPANGRWPSWLLLLAEAISGLKLNHKGALEPTSLNRAQTIREIRQMLNEDARDDDWTIWGRWFLADPARRAISPFSKAGAN